MISFSILMRVDGGSSLDRDYCVGNDPTTDSASAISSSSSGVTSTSSSVDARNPVLARMSFFSSMSPHTTVSLPPVPASSSLPMSLSTRGALMGSTAGKISDPDQSLSLLSPLPAACSVTVIPSPSTKTAAVAAAEAATAALDRESPRGDVASNLANGGTGSGPSSLNTGLTLTSSPMLLSSCTSTVSEDAKLMVYMGVDCVLEIFAVQSSRTRDFCRLLIKIGLLRHISLAFDCIYDLVKRSTICCSPSCQAAQRKRRGTNSKCNSVTSVKGHERKGSDFSDHSVVSKPDLLNSCNQECRYLSNIANIFLKFSRSDAPVALQMARDHQVIKSIMAVLNDPRLQAPIWNTTGTISTSSTESRTSYGTNASNKSNIVTSVLGLSPCTVGIIETLLKCLKNLSMESSALADLEKAGIIPMLVSLLGGPVSNRCKNHIVPCIFNMCRINKRRQEDAVVHGLIPHLQSLIVNDSHLKQFALPILCSLAYTSATTRAELSKYCGAAFYINLLKESYWQTFALNSLAVW